MPNVIKTTNGFIPVACDGDEVSNILKTLTLLVETGIEETDIRKKTSICSSIMQSLNKLLGSNFNTFLALNYDDGAGPLAGLVTAIKGYLKGEVGWSSIASAILVEEVKLGSADHALTEPEVRFIEESEGLRYKLNLPSQAMNKLAAGVGPINLGKIVLIASGVIGYVK